MLSFSRYDRALAGYLKVKRKQQKSVTPLELTHFLYYELDVEMDEAALYAMDFLERRQQAWEIIRIVEQRRQELLDAERKALIATLRRFGRREHLRRRYGFGGRMLFLALAFVSTSDEMSKMFWVLYGFMILIGDSLINYVTARKRDLATMKRLIKLGGVRSVGLLAEATAIYEIRTEAETALIAVLPELKASDAFLFNEEQRRFLYTALERSNRKLIFAILKVLEQIGDEKAISYVERLVAGQFAGSDLKVRQAAYDCLPYLRMRAVAHKESQMLLRPSSSSEVVTTAPDTLLRPASYHSSTEPEQLLRASNAED